MEENPFGYKSGSIPSNPCHDLAVLQQHFAEDYPSLPPLRAAIIVDIDHKEKDMPWTAMLPELASVCDWTGYTNEPKLLRSRMFPDETTCCELCLFSMSRRDMRPVVRRYHELGELAYQSLLSLRHPGTRLQNTPSCNGVSMLWLIDVFRQAWNAGGVLLAAHRFRLAQTNDGPMKIDLDTPRLEDADVLCPLFQHDFFAVLRDNVFASSARAIDVILASEKERHTTAAHTDPSSFAAPRAVADGANPPADATGKEMLSCPDLAERFDVDPERLRGRLKRWMPDHESDWKEVAERGPNEPRYLYRLSAVMPLVKSLRASGQRPAKKTSR